MMNERKRISLKDVAKEAGVSAMSVSAALNGSGRISAAKAAEIRAIAARIGYKSNVAAQILKGKKGKDVGLLFLENTQIVRRLGALSLMALIFSEECRRLGLRPHIEWFDYTQNPGRSPDIFHNGLVDGLLVYGYGSPEINETLRNGLALPSVRLMEPGPLSVYVDYRRAIVEIMTWLVAHGHRRLMLISGKSDTNFHVFKTAKDTFFEQAKELCLAPNDLFFLENRNDIEFREFVAHLADEVVRSKPSALIVHNTVLVKALICELIRRGVRVPEDVSVIAFGSYEFDAEFNIPISSADIDVREIVIPAVRILRETLIDREPAETSIAVPARLTLRDSAIGKRG